MIETGRLVLRGWKEADKAPFHAMCNDPAVMEYLGVPLSHAEIDAATARQNALQAERGYCFWAVERKAGRDLLGFCGLKPGPPGTPLEGRIEFGWRLAAEHWGRGYAVEAARPCFEYAFGTLGRDRVVSLIRPDNQRSIRVAEKLGERLAGEIDLLGGKCLVYERRREEGR